MCMQFHPYFWFNYLCKWLSITFLRVKKIIILLRKFSFESAWGSLTGLGRARSRQAEVWRSELLDHSSCCGPSSAFSLATANPKNLIWELWWFMPTAELVVSGGEWLLGTPVNPSIFCRICIDFHWCWQWPFLETGRVGFGPWHQSFQTEVGISQEPKETVALTKILTQHKCRDNTPCIYPTNIRTAF